MAKTRAIDPKEDPRLNDQQFPCFYCRHLTEIGTQDGEDWTCPAFPAGIPYYILTRSEPHTKVLRGLQEGDVVFESRKVYDFPDGRNYATFDGEWVTEKEAKGS